MTSTFGFKFIKGVKNTLVDALSRLIYLELTEPNPSEKEGNKYGYAMFEQLPDIHVDSSTHNPVPPIDISNINATNGTGCTGKKIIKT